MKIKPILFVTTAAAAVLAVAILTHPTHAAAPDTTAPAAPDATAGMATNSGDTMAALFGDPVIASGKGVTVKRSELDQFVTDIKSRYAAQGQTIPPDKLMLYEGAKLEDLINTQLLLQEATDADRAAAAKDVDDAIAALLKQLGSQDELNMRLMAAGMTEDQWRSKLEEQATATATLRRELNVKVTDADVQQFYDLHPQQFEEPEMVHVRHILLMTIDPATGQPLSDDVVQEKRKQADGIVARARSGEDFAKLAEEYSDDTRTKYKGGDLTPFPRTVDETHRVLPAEFEAAAFSLTNNQISDVIETRLGFEIIQKLNTVPAKKLTLADKIPSSDTAEIVTNTVSDAVKQGLEQQKIVELAPAYMDKLKKAADVKILDPDLNAAVQEVEQLSATNAPAGAAPAAAPAN